MRGEQGLQMATLFSKLAHDLQKNLTISSIVSLRASVAIELQQAIERRHAQ